jgi:hypothetical protein
MALRGEGEEEGPATARTARLEERENRRGEE